MPTQPDGDLRAFDPLVNSGIFWLDKLMVKSWGEPVRQLRAELGLPPGEDPLFEGQHTPELVLALFSQVFAKHQLDWPKQARLTGFVFMTAQAAQQGFPQSYHTSSTLVPPTHRVHFRFNSSAGCRQLLSRECDRG